MLSDGGTNPCTAVESERSRQREPRVGAVSFGEVDAACGSGTHQRPFLGVVAGSLADLASYLARRPNRYFAGIGVNLCPSASVMAANILVAGEEQTLSRGSLARVGDSAQSPDAMSLLVCTATVMSPAA
jgi:hypothetical protein